MACLVTGNAGHMLWPNRSFALEAGRHRPGRQYRGFRGSCIGPTGGVQARLALPAGSLFAVPVKSTTALVVAMVTLCTDNWVLFQIAITTLFVAYAITRLEPW